MPHPTVAGRYRLLEQIGAGGMGVVWRAEDERLRRPVAVKLLRPPLGLSEDEAELATQRAMREARITARLHHPHAVAVFDVVQHEGRPGLVMQYVPSVPLSSVLREGGPLSQEEAARLGAEVASALAAAHQLDIVHRDVKPGNILVAEDGSAMLSDFGISRVLGDATLTVTGMVHGTPAYLAPEVARGASSDAATDVYSLGATLYAALEGHPPFGSDPNPIVLLHLVARGEFPPPQRSGPLTPLLLRMLSVAPADRPSMAAVAAELAAVRVALAQGVAPTQALPVPPPATAGPAPQATAMTPLLPAAPATGSAAMAAQTSDQTSVRPVGPPPSATAPDATPGRDPPDREPATRRSGRPGRADGPARPPAGGRGGGRGPRPAGGAGRDPGQPRWSRHRRQPVSRPPRRPRAPRLRRGPAPPAPHRGRTPSRRRPARRSRRPPRRRRAPARRRRPRPAHRARPASAGESALVQSVADYYSVLPKDTDAGWALLTSRYQRSSGGRAGYDRFWGDFSQVSTSKVRARGADRVEATVSYVYKDGRKTSERRSFTLVPDGGVLKIDASAVEG